MIAFLTHGMAVGSAEIAGMRRLGSWTAYVQHAARVLCELEAIEGLRGQIQMFRRCRTPTLLLLGGASPPAYQDTAEGLLQTLQSSRIAVLKGQAHAAINAAPKLVADQIVRFLTAPATTAIRRTRVPRSRAS